MPGRILYIVNLQETLKKLNLSNLTRHLHIISSTVGSIWEITKDITNFLVKDGSYHITKEWEGETPMTYDILLCHFISLLTVNSKYFNKFRKKILIQPIDGTDIKLEFINAFNKFDLIICPAQASKNILKNNGVTTEIIVIPNFYKDNIYQKEVYNEVEKFIPNDKFIFYHESTFHPRKGIEILYESYIKAFSDRAEWDNVLLVLKDQNYNSRTFKDVESIKRQAMNLQKQYIRPSRIIKFSSEFNEDNLKALWHRTNCYVSFAKIEGFGIPLLRMSVLEKQLLVLENPFSGYNDYLVDSTDTDYTGTFFIPTKQCVATNEFMELYSDKTTWAIPKIDDCVDYFRSMYKNKIQRNKPKTDIEIDNEYKEVMLKYKKVLN